ncbi:MoxR family ATPase [Cyclobacteriaceae bacterium]|nr:MoxR family ATPase [Cyclobacteriaceae bacterium]
MSNFSSDVEAAKSLQQSFEKLSKEISKQIVGQEEVVKLVITSIFCNGHSLLVGVPGLAKTLLVNTLSKCMNLGFNRVQFTPDLMPSDILGSETLDSNKQLVFVKGPIFSNIILADEINRTPPKTQAALLEAMQEKRVTIAGENFELPKPFFVLATQNPIEQEGTYPLPEAQLDRFMFNILLDYPTFEQEVNIIKSTTSNTKVELNAVVTAEEISAYQELVRKVPIADNVVEYAVNLVQKTRPNTDKAAPVTNEFIDWGAGPRAAQFLVLGAKCNALINGKLSPDIEDIQSVAKPILRHRLMKNFKAEAEGLTIESIIEKLF